VAEMLRWKNPLNLGTDFAKLIRKGFFCQTLATITVMEKGDKYETNNQKSFCIVSVVCSRRLYSQRKGADGRWGGRGKGSRNAVAG
jgi:hypothetical protein